METPTQIDPPVALHRLVRPLPSAERGCNGKINLGRLYAWQADKLSAKHGKRYGVYRCPHCQGTHLTTKLEKSEEYAELLHISEPNVKSVARREKGVQSEAN